MVLRLTQNLLYNNLSTKIIRYIKDTKKLPTSFSIKIFILATGACIQTSFCLQCAQYIEEFCQYWHLLGKIVIAAKFINAAKQKMGKFYTMAFQQPALWKVWIPVSTKEMKRKRFDKSNLDKVMKSWQEIAIFAKAMTKCLFTLCTHSYFATSCGKNFRIRKLCAKKCMNIVTEQARKPRSYASLKLWLSNSATHRGKV